MKVLTNQEERFLIFAMKNIPAKYSKAAICQCLAISCRLDHESVRRVVGVSLGYVKNSVSGLNVIKWSDRPERIRLTNYLKPRVKEATTNVRMFLVAETDNNPVYLITTDGKDPDEDSKMLHTGYINIHKRQDTKYKVRAGNYSEVDILLTSFGSMRVKDLINKSR